MHPTGPVIDRTLAGLAWLVLYLLIVLVPVFLMLAPPAPSGRGFWLEFSIALGFIGLTQIGLQFLLIARFRRLTAPYGIDVILRYHRQIAVVAVAAILLHPLIIVIDNPSRLRMLNPVGGNWASRLGLLAVAALVTTVIVSVYRERVGLNYERWRALHIALGVTAIASAQAHASLAGLYTNTRWKQAVWIGMAAFMVGLVLYLRVVKPFRQRNYRWRVAEVRRERGSTYTLALEPVGEHAMRFEPGQFAWLKLAHSPYTLDEHPFSFSSSAERTDRVEFGIKALGDFTSAIGDVPPGTRAFLDGPHGAFSIDRYPAPGYVFYAGGAGITPFLSMLNTMADRGDPRPVLLVYADRTWERVAYREELDVLRQRMSLDIEYVLERPPEGWTGESGFITSDLLERVLPREDYSRFHLICGPPPMMEIVMTVLREHGVPPTRIQLEKFALV